MTRTCSVPGCKRPHSARSLCHPHYLQAWSSGTLPVGDQRSCACCGETFLSVHGKADCSPECFAVRRSKAACERKGAVGEWLTTADRMRALAVVAGLMERGYKRVPKRSPSRRLNDPHFSAWKVGKVYIVTWYDPTEQREKAAA